MTTFRFTAEPDAKGAAAFRRHMGARRFAYNECRRAVVAALAAKRVDASWGRFAQMVAYKADWFGSDLCVAPRFFPSTKTCSTCGWCWSDMALKDRTFICASCGLVTDRDLNAAINLAAWANAEHVLASQAPDPQAGGRVDNACGDSGAGHQIPGGETALATVHVNVGKEAGTGSVLASPV